MESNERSFNALEGTALASSSCRGAIAGIEGLMVVMVVMVVVDIPCSSTRWADGKKGVGERMERQRETERDRERQRERPEMVQKQTERKASQFCVGVVVCSCFSPA